jgi:hypothetical protein
MQKDATRGPPGDVQDCGEAGHAPSPPPPTPGGTLSPGQGGSGRPDDDSRMERSLPLPDVRSDHVGGLKGGGRLLYIEQSCYFLSMRPPVPRAKIRNPSPVLAVVLLAILVMASAVLGWLGGLVAWLIVLGALAVFAFCLRGGP